jgi:hypothetical protein
MNATPMISVVLLLAVHHKRTQLKGMIAGNETTTRKEGKRDIERKKEMQRPMHKVIPIPNVGFFSRPNDTMK